MAIAVASAIDRLAKRIAMAICRSLMKVEAFSCLLHAVLNQGDETSTVIDFLLSVTLFPFETRPEY